MNITHILELIGFQMGLYYTISFFLSIAVLSGYFLGRWNRK